MFAFDSPPKNRSLLDFRDQSIAQTEQEVGVGWVGNKGDAFTGKLIDNLYHAVSAEARLWILPMSRLMPMDP